MIPLFKTAHIWQRLLIAACMFASAARAEDETPWSVASKNADLTVYERLHKGSDLREFKAIGTFEQSPEVVRRVLEDVDAYPSFMPYVTEARVISRDANSRVSYQRISPPIVGDRDYTIKVRLETRRMSNGAVCYCNRWQAANELGPAEKAGIARVKITEGSWLLEPASGGQQTRATYFIYSDSGGTLPAFVVNGASKTAIPKLFESIGKQAQLAKYRRAQ